MVTSQNCGGFPLFDEALRMCIGGIWSRSSPHLQMGWHLRRQPTSKDGDVISQYWVVNTLSAIMCMKETVVNNESITEPMQ